ncbi:MAG TPA: hypothetical protein VMT68_13205 [Caulobacteraceae bacterium]|nr:hypothetical protein [Caulobacteraceae bacterium]
MRRPLAATLIATTLLAGAARAQPPAPAAPPPPSTPPTGIGIARCIWDALPAATRAALIASGPSIDDIGKAVGGMNPALMALAKSQCPTAPTPAVEGAAKEAWAGVVMSKWSEGQLAARYRVTPADLARGWARVPAPARSQIAAGFDKTPEESRPAIAPFAQSLKLTDPPALDLLSAWAIAQIRLAAIG